jgi:hypothetical protein
MTTETMNPMPKNLHVGHRLRRAISRTPRTQREEGNVLH